LVCLILIGGPVWAMPAVVKKPAKAVVHHVNRHRSMYISGASSFFMGYRIGRKVTK
jgi:hypothetical protein